MTCDQGWPPAQESGFENTVSTAALLVTLEQASVTVTVMSEPSSVGVSPVSSRTGASLPTTPPVAATRSSGFRCRSPPRRTAPHRHRTRACSPVRAAGPVGSGHGHKQARAAIRRAQRRPCPGQLAFGRAPSTPTSSPSTTSDDSRDVLPAVARGRGGGATSGGTPHRGDAPHAALDTCADGPLQPAIRASFGA